MPDKPETTAQNEDHLPSESLEVPRPATYVPPEVRPASSDTLITAMAQNGVPRPPPPKPLLNDEPVLETGTVDVISTVQQVPQPESAKPEAPAIRNSASEAEKVKKRQNVLNRVFWSLVMIGIFIGMLPVSSSRRYD
jgi:hypothetical protein